MLDHSGTLFRISESTPRTIEIFDFERYVDLATNLRLQFESEILEFFK